MVPEQKEGEALERSDPEEPLRDNEIQHGDLPSGDLGTQCNTRGAVPCRVCPISCHVVSSRVVSCRVVSRGVVFRVSLFRVVSCHVVFHFVFSVPCHHSPCFLCRVVFPATLVSSFPVFLHHDILDVTHYYEILLPETKRTSPHVSCISSL